MQKKFTRNLLRRMQDILENDKPFKILFMQFYFTFSILSVIITYCTSLNDGFKRDETKKISCIQFIFDMPQLSSNGSIFEYNGFFNIYHYSDLVMYEFNYWNDTITEKGELKEGNERTLFIFKRNEKYGYEYDMGRKKGIKKQLLVDSLLEMFAFKNAKWDIMLSDTPYLTIYDSARGILQDIYVTNLPNDPMINDSTYCYYSDRLDSLDYSLSPKMDSIKGMKLYRFVMVHDPIYSKENNKMIPKRVFNIEILSIPVKDPEEKLEYFKRYRKMISGPGP